jgi:lipid-A-disaccharide synthase
VTHDSAPRIALLAGEASGDTLGAALMEALAQRLPGARFLGMTGPRMREAGCESIADCEEIAVIGLVEVLSHLPRLLRLRARLVRELTAWQPDIFIGIDAPDFNLGVARRLRDGAGIRTVQYVSPQFWAWRSGRVRSIHRSVDHVLCLLPFEAAFYDAHHVAATFIGHPLADRIPLSSDRDAARVSLGLARELPLLAVLPGSRRGEVKRLGPDLIATMQQLRQHRPDIGFVVPFANDKVRSAFEQLLLDQGAQDLPLARYDGQSVSALSAADVVLLASGTATLETMLVKRPMVVCYRVAPLSAWIARRLKLMKTERFAMPNLLAGRDLVPELMQEALTPAAMTAAVEAQFDRSAESREELDTVFRQIHLQLRRDASARAADAVMSVLCAGSQTAARDSSRGRS